jgi:hypothetical protein
MVSTRHIDWISLSLTFAAHVIRKSSKFSKFTLCKLLYGKYDDSQYKSDKAVCPICREGVDDREHLLHCSKTQHLWDIADAENTFTPAEQRLYQRMHISSEHLLSIRRTISDTIRLDAFTRIGVFNQSQQDHILQSLGTAYVDESVGHEIRREIEQQLAPWIRAMTIAVKLRNSSKHGTNQKEETKETRDTLVDYNCFDELPDYSSDDDTPTTRVAIINRHTETTDLIYSAGEFDDYITDDLFLTIENMHPTSPLLQFPQHNTSCLAWRRFRVGNHSMWITPTLQMQHMIDDMGLPRAAVISSSGDIQRCIRHISSNHLDSMRSAIRLILALENSLKLNRLPTMVNSF